MQFKLIQYVYYSVCMLCRASLSLGIGSRCPGELLEQHSMCSNMSARVYGVLASGLVSVSTEQVAPLPDNLEIEVKEISEEASWLPLLTCRSRKSKNNSEITYSHRCEHGSQWNIHHVYRNPGMMCLTDFRDAMGACTILHGGNGGGSNTSAMGAPPGYD